MKKYNDKLKERWDDYRDINISYADPEMDYDEPINYDEPMDMNYSEPMDMDYEDEMMDYDEDPTMTMDYEDAVEFDDEIDEYFVDEDDNLYDMETTDYVNFNDVDPEFYENKQKDKVKFIKLKLIKEGKEKLTEAGDTKELISILQADKFSNEQKRKEFIKIITSIFSIGDADARKFIKKLGDACTEIGAEMNGSDADSDEKEEMEEKDALDIYRYESKADLTSKDYKSIFNKKVILDEKIKDIIALDNEKAILATTKADTTSENYKNRVNKKVALKEKVSDVVETTKKVLKDE